MQLVLLKPKLPCQNKVFYIYVCVSLFWRASSVTVWQTWFQETNGTDRRPQNKKVPSGDPSHISKHWRWWWHWSYMKNDPRRAKLSRWHWLLNLRFPLQYLHYLSTISIWHNLNNVFFVTWYSFYWWCHKTNFSENR